MKPTDILGNIKLYNADCMEVMKTFKDKQFDLAIVDPPYGIGENGQRNVTGDRPTVKWKNPKSKHYKTFDDSEIPSEQYFNELFRVSKNQIVWGGNYFTEFLKPSKGWLVWDKQADIKEHLSMCELAWSSFDRKCNKFEYLWAGFKKKHQVERIHPTQKPVQLYKWILQNYAKEGDTILDTHFGSLSIGIACYDLKFDLTAIELDKDYYEQAKQRLINHQRHLTLF
ncbi:MAG: site-specific DNA-methyltransferase [Bacteroidetes bacterium]|nr:site-specific DNA-methyltransferase [Bacteroidota bacterium]